MVPGEAGLRYPLHRPVLGPEEQAAAGAVLASGMVASGPRVAEFEQLVADRLGASIGVACSSGTAALHLAALALDVGSDDEVIVPAFGFPATANIVELCGARAVAADVSLDDFSLSAESVAAVATARTVGVIAVHPFGIPAPLAALEALAAARGWWLMEDAACALGTAGAGEVWARPDNLVCLSFHGRKVLTTGEGGLVATRDPRLGERLRRWRNHGIGAPAAADSPWLKFRLAGLNYRMSDINGAIGLVQMGRLDAIVAGRQQVVDLYRGALRGVSGVYWHPAYDQAGLSCQSMVVTLDDAVDRAAVISGLADQGIQTTLAGYGLARQPYYRDRYGWEPASLPVSERLFDQALTLPLVDGMDTNDVATIVVALQEVMRGAGG